MDLLDIRKTLDSTAGRQLKDYLLMRLDQLKNIENVAEKDSPSHQALEIKAQKRAYAKLKEIYKDIMTFSEELKEKDPRDSYEVE